MISLLFLDDYHVGDPLFQTDLGRRLAKLAPGSKTVILHRVEEAVEGALENVEREDDAAVLAERAIRETNQAITRRLTEEGVPAVSVQGSDHGLFEVDGGDSPQSVRAAGADWLRRTVGLGTIPVISPIARIAGEVALTRTVDPVDCATTLSSSLMAGGDELEAVLFCSTRKGGLIVDSKIVESLSFADLGPHSDILDVKAAAALVRVATRVVATNSVAFAKGRPLAGTIISPTV